METASIIYSVLGLLSALGVGGWVKKYLDWGKMEKEAAKWWKKAADMKDVAVKAKKFSKDGYQKHEIEDLLDDIQDIFDKEE